MATQKELFTLGAEELGKGEVLFSWTGDGCHLAAVGSRRCVSICARSGSVVDEVAVADAEPPGSDRQSPVAALEVRVVQQWAGSICRLFARLQRSDRAKL